jgi:hypothetical protein
MHVALGVEPAAIVFVCLCVCVFVCLCVCVFVCLCVPYRRTLQCPSSLTCEYMLPNPSTLAAGQDDGAADVLVGLTRVEDVPVCTAIMGQHPGDAPLLELALASLRSISVQPGAVARMGTCLDPVVGAMRGHPDEAVLVVRMACSQRAMLHACKLAHAVAAWRGFVHVLCTKDYS